MPTFLEFVKSHSTLENNTGAQDVFDFLNEPANIHNMIIFSNLGLPALSGLVSDLEKKFANDPDFPLSDFRHRQVVGKMIKYILSFYGYTPQAGGLDERARIRNFSNSAYFKTASVYALNETPKLHLEVTIK